MNINDFETLEFIINNFENYLLNTYMMVFIHILQKNRNISNL